MNLTRRAVLAAVTTLPLGTARAQTWPSKPITMIVPSTAGGVVDNAARNIQQYLANDLGQPIIVDDKPGGGGHIGAGAVAHAAPDGYTILCSAGSILISGIVQNLTYKPMTDLAPVCRLVLGGFFLLVSSSSPFKSLAELIAYGRANPGKLTYGSTSVGNSTHIAGEMLSLLTGMRAVHVPYKGNVQSLTDVAAGRVDFSIDSGPPSQPLVRAGLLRPLAVTTTGRQPDSPNLPAINEQVPGYGIEGWIGLFVPAKTAPDIVARLAQSARRTMSEPAIIQRFHDAGGGDAAFLGPADTLKYMQIDHERVNRVVRQANITAT